MTTPRFLSLRRALSVLSALATLSLFAACGGGGDAAPPQQMIGAAGGTVAGPNGAQVVVPAGALAANTAIAVAQSSTGSPALPAGLSAVGQVFAFTPHGTAFATPATVTLPFDAASVPAGATVLLFKTNAAGAWEQVPSATLSAGTLSAQVKSFSWFTPVVMPVADVQVTAPGSATFSVSASGFNAPFSYQWEKSDDAGVTRADIQGATLSNYTTGATAVASDNGDRYRVRVSNSLDTATSNWATLTVTSAAPTTATLSVSVVGGGSVTSNPGGIDCGADCTETYAMNAVVALTPSAAAGFTFSAWSGDADCADASLTMSAARACTATFVAAPAGSLAGTWISNYQCTGTGGNFNGQDTLTVTQNGASVSFTSSDGGSFTGTLNGNTMSYSGGGPGYTETGTWTLQAAGNSFTKTSNYVNTGGTGGSCPGAGQRQGVPFTLLVIVTGNGRVSDGSGGINLCGPASGDCTQAYPSGTQVTLSATENAPGVVFNGWGAACFDVPSPFAARVIMDSSKTCTASFSP